jgi:hypothetical protein
MVVDSVTSAVTAVDIIHVPVVQDVIAVVIMTCDDGLDVAQFPHLRKQAGIQPGRARRFTVLAGEETSTVLQPFRNFTKGDVEEGDRGDGGTAIETGE